MKLQPMTRGRWAELIFGVVLPMIFLVPFFLGMMGLAVVDLFSGATILLFSTIPIVAISCLCSVILFGPEQIRRVPSLRFVTVVLGFLGLGHFVLFFLPPFLSDWNAIWRGPISLSPRVIFRGDDWRLLLLGTIGPVVLGVKYIPQLVRRSR